MVDRYRFKIGYRIKVERVRDPAGDYVSYADYSNACNKLEDNYTQSLSKFSEIYDNNTAKAEAARAKKYDALKRKYENLQEVCEEQTKTLAAAEALLKGENAEVARLRGKLDIINNLSFLDRLKFVFSIYEG